MCSPFYLISLLVICAVAGQGISVIILDYFFFHSERKQTERKLTNHCTCIAVQFSKSDKMHCFSFWSFRCFYRFYRQSTLIYVYAQPKLHTETGVYRVNILQIPDLIISKGSTRYLKRSVLRCFLAPIVFVLFETILFWSFCVHLQKRIQTFEDCI